MDAQLRLRRCHVRPRQSASGGFSVTELIMALGIGGMIAGFGIPAFYDTVRNARLATATNQLVAALNYSRSEAIKRNQTVVLCRSQDRQSCAKSPGFRSDWGGGWIVFVNEDDDDQRDSEEPLLRVYSGTPAGISLFFNQRWRVNYRPSGRAKNGTFTFCDSRGPDRARAVVLYFSGRPRVAAHAADGGPLVCGGA